MGEFRSRTNRKANLQQSAIKLAQTDSTHSVNRVFSERIISRAPDKMIDFLDNHILLAYRNLIIYMDVSEYGLTDGEVTSDVRGANDSHFIEIVVPPEKIFQLELLQKYKIICIQEIGNGMSAFVLEDLISK